jgi:hypothetical protein
MVLTLKTKPIKTKNPPPPHPATDIPLIRLQIAYTVLAV